jgi:hypothetical protein
MPLGGSLRGAPCSLPPAGALVGAVGVLESGVFLLRLPPKQPRLSPAQHHLMMKIMKMNDEAIITMKTMEGVIMG